jgi:hypothetical protein
MSTAVTSLGNHIRVNVKRVLLGICKIYRHAKLRGQITQLIHMSQLFGLFINVYE